EAVLTYFIVRALSDHLSRFGLWDDFFGRDRFFAMVLVSIGVRLICEAWFFPIVGEAAVRTFGVTFDYHNRLHSVGFVVVPLLANVFWKPGLRRGFLPAAFLMTATYLVVRYVLIPYTNYSVARFDLLYEDVARGLDSGPKVYIVLVVGAWMASRVNLKYGWDMGGILVPTLLMLAWTTPTKIVATAGEATLVAAVARYILGSRFLESTTIEGPRRTLLVFSVGMVIKFIVGHMTAIPGLGFKATDMYGFGYMLPTLLADKILTKNSLGIVLIPVLRTSLIGFAIANGVGYGLYVASDYLATSAATHDDAPHIEVRDAPLADVLTLDRARILPAEARNTYDTPLARELSGFRQAFATIRDRDEAHYPEALDTLADLDMHAVRVRDAEAGITSIYMRETGARAIRSAAGADREFGADRRGLHGRGIYVVNEAPRADIVIEVPRPRAEWKTLDAAAALYTRLGARALIVAGAHARASRDASADVLREPGTLYHEAHRAVLDSTVIQVRGSNEDESELWVKRSLPGEGLDLRELRDVIGEFRLTWEETGVEDIQRRDSRGSFATLSLSRAARRRAVVWGSGARAVRVDTTLRPADTLIEHFRSTPEILAPRGSELYRPPTMPELLYFDEAVITPLLAYARAWRPGHPLGELDSIAVAAARFRYELAVYEVDDAHFVVLAEDMAAGGGRRYWGTYAFRAGQAEPVIVEIPHPVGEFGTLDMGIRLSQDLSARALFIAGAHRAANRDGSTDWTDGENTRSVFHLAHQIVVRDSAGLGDPLVAQIRGFRPKDREWQTPVGEVALEIAATRSDIVISLGVETPSRAVTPPQALELETALAGLGHTVDYFDGGPQHMAFAARDNLQLRHMTGHDTGTFAHVWVSDDIRSRYRQATVSESLRDLTVQLAIPSATTDIVTWLMDRPTGGSPGDSTSDAAFAHEFLRLARAYKSLGNAAAIAELLDLAEEAAVDLSLVIDPTSGHAYLAAWGRGGVAFRTTGERASGDASPRRSEPRDASAFREYARGGTEALIIGPPPGT
ncbi:hypothetical protein HN937_27185, partial [Candidatus Poribacteria bacterium]|nr:hypothetical protein [Candidatus Poribacteria bacterium]